MSPIEIIPVVTGKERKRFIGISRRIYRRDPCWVPPLASEMKELLDRSKHPFFKHSSADFFLARRDGRWVGRIAAILNNNHNRFHKENTAFFGFFESIDDGEVSSALLDHAERWARDRGMKQLRGPMSFSTNEICGLLVDGFDFPPSVMMAHNPDYYSGLIE